MTSGAPRPVDVGFVPRVPGTVASVEVDGDTVVYDGASKSVHVLSPTATLIWSGIDGHTSLGQISRDLGRSFGADLDIVRSDVLDLAADLMEKGLISEAGPQDAEEARPTLGGPRFLQDPPGG